MSHQQTPPRDLFHLASPYLHAMKTHQYLCMSVGELHYLRNQRYVLQLLVATVLREGGKDITCPVLPGPTSYSADRQNRGPTPSSSYCL